jgi:hypothetical protein
LKRGASEVNEVSNRVENANPAQIHELGQTMTEYGVVLTMITIAIVTAIALLSDSIERSVLRVVTLIP